jgi:hypothetical protein
LPVDADIAAFGNGRRDFPQGDRPTIWVGPAQLAGQSTISGRASA